MIPNSRRFRDPDGALDHPLEWVPAVSFLLEQLGLPRFKRIERVNSDLIALRMPEEVLILKRDQGTVWALSKPCLPPCSPS